MKKTFLKSFFVSFIIFSLVWSGFIYKTVIKATSDGEEEEYKETFIDRLMDGKDDITFLLLGVDSKDVSKSSGARTDTMMLCRVDKSTGDATILSIPRDTKARIRGRKYEEKINHAHAYGGPELSVKAVKDLLGIDLEYYVKVDYKIVREFVDLIGGVELDVPMDMKYSDPVADPPLYIDLNKGYQTLDGDKALQFLRFRKGYADQDLGRIKAQQQFIKAAADKALRPANIVNIPQMIKSYYNNVDTNIPLDVIMKFAMKANTFNTESIQAATLPGDTKYISGVSYFIPYEEETNKLVKSLFTEHRTVENIEDMDDELN
ncbi:Cell envelope-related transcriptional attenuator [[Clostridium] ultunense Esp]|uniref:Cell envelope-related transcriptional attenuator n=1 Tax=[Clostridium] ultunense Esp TaxID=1288971 RepID=M1YQ01_9FIRM|nr:LCP family protein [Schnuerera ultunensis]CCQ92625.1 Cell envelope-related transcriptional attenuator [[Clostridium] ultunense Esp]SHD77927.1 Cell envelope-related transcriptional attenuator [[Clostridium] ultunense Esp]